MDRYALRLFVTADLLRHLVAVQLRHHQVEHREVGKELRHEPHSFLAVRCLYDLVVRSLEPERHELADVAIVVCHEDEGTRARLGPAQVAQSGTARVDVTRPGRGGAVIIRPPCRTRR